MVNTPRIKKRRAAEEKGSCPFGKKKRLWLGNWDVDGKKGDVLERLEGILDEKKPPFLPWGEDVWLYGEGRYQREGGERVK